MKRSWMLVVSLRVINQGSGLTKSVDDETPPFLAVKVSFRVHLKN